ncbi:MAG: hypothetical protein KAS32_29740 [Candidatus Peribacteraceae bacterium]|nr:hypothetical protein [Candidatus Peribacteraceae bacterium]
MDKTRCPKCGAFTKWGKRPIILAKQNNGTECSSYGSQDWCNNCDWHSQIRFETIEYWIKECQEGRAIPAGYLQHRAQQDFNIQLD